jgi:phosphopentomutase
MCSFQPCLREVSVPRVIIIVLDGVAVGELPDAARYGDVGSDTLGNLSRAVGGLNLPSLQSLGLGNLHRIAGVPPVPNPAAAYGRMCEISAGKDSTTGHWELMGLLTTRPFPTYPNGFPPEIIDAFRDAAGYDVLGNVAASGTEIIQRLGDEHVATGKLIVYTSADSVFQIAAHEDIVPVAELYRVCEIARRLLVPPHNVSRVIARPFAGTSGHYERTPRRHDYSLEPPPGLLLPALAGHGVAVQAVGKIYDLYAGQGIGPHVGSRNNAEGMAALARLFREAGDAPTLLLLNLVDFDMLWGHRNDAAGMARGLVEFDAWLAGFLEELRPGDLLIMTADHGNDPTTPSTDHSREYVPLLVCSGDGPLGADLGTRETFADVAATVAEAFGLPATAEGTSFLAALRPGRAGGGRR